MFTNVLVILACCCCIWCETLNVGKCPLSEYIKKTRICTSQFIRELQTNSWTNCSVLYDDMLRCIKDFVRICLQGYRTESEINTHLEESAKKLKTKAYYCNSTHHPPILSDLEKKGFPCIKEFFTKAIKCTEELRTKFRTSPADPTLCSEFMRTKSCMKALVDKYCVLDQRARNIMSHAFDDYNPFCKVTFFPTTVSAQSLSSVASQEERHEGSWIVDPDSNEEHADMLGRCGVLAQLNRTRACTTAFVKSYQKNPLGNCSKLFNEMLDCVKCVIRSCLKDYFKESEISLRLQEFISMTKTENLFCGGMMDVPHVQTSGSSPACDQQYGNTARACIKTFNETFRLNASSPKLCSEFTEAKLCLREVIEKHCNETGAKSYAALEYTYILDDYNPFCEGNKDFSDGKDPSSSPSPLHANISNLDPCVKTPTIVTQMREVSSAPYKSTTNMTFFLVVLCSVARGLRMC